MLTACSVEEPDASSRSALLTSREWSIVSVVNLTSADTTLLDSCALDNRLIYEADGTYWVDQGAAHCVANLPQRVRFGTWTLDASGSLLSYQLEDVADPAVFTVVFLTETQLILLNTEPGNQVVQTVLEKA